MHSAPRIHDAAFKQALSQGPLGRSPLVNISGALLLLSLMLSMHFIYIRDPGHQELHL